MLCLKTSPTQISTFNSQWLYLDPVSIFMNKHKTILNLGHNPVNKGKKLKDNIYPD